MVRGAHLLKFYNLVKSLRLNFKLPKYRKFKTYNKTMHIFQATCNQCTSRLQVSKHSFEISVILRSDFILSVEKKCFETRGSLLLVTWLAKLEENSERHEDTLNHTACSFDGICERWVTYEHLVQNRHVHSRNPNYKISIN